MIKLSISILRHPLAVVALAAALFAVVTGLPAMAQTSGAGSIAGTITDANRTRPFQALQ